MFRKHFDFLKWCLINLPGWRTHRKIVVIESDDWGSIRTPSLEVYKTLVKKGFRLDKLAYNRYDSLESEDDLRLLFEVLHNVKDKTGNPAIITANTIVGNPDFDKIRESNFKEYYWEPFIETMKRYPCHENSYYLMKEGIKRRLYKPQFHGREHLNVKRWMKSLQENSGNMRTAFDFRMYDLSESVRISENSFMEAFNLRSEVELAFQKDSISEGLALFEQIFGFRSSSFIAPCYTWSRSLNETLLSGGVTILQGNYFQLEPRIGDKHKFKRIIHFTGQKNSLGQVYLVRNAAFEPSQAPDFNFIEEILRRGNIAFGLGKPLIIGSHRLNYIGSY